MLQQAVRERYGLVIGEAVTGTRLYLQPLFDHLCVLATARPVGRRRPERSAQCRTLRHLVACHRTSIGGGDCAAERDQWGSRGVHQKDEMHTGQGGVVGTQTRNGPCSGLPRHAVLSLRSTSCPNSAWYALLHLPDMQERRLPPEEPGAALAAPAWPIERPAWPNVFAGEKSLSRTESPLSKVVLDQVPESWKGGVSVASTGKLEKERHIAVGASFCRILAACRKGRAGL